MTPERWNRVIETFHSVLEQPLSQADEFLRDRCADDTKLYAEVRAMLEQHSRSGLLDRPVLIPSETSVFSAGQIISGRYRIVRSLGRGGMGEVYEAEDLELKERVALKTLLLAIAGDERMIARFKQEIQLARKISHPNVCRVFDLARHPADGSSPETIVFLTMELLDGETLAARLQREGRLAPHAALPLLDQIAEALDAAHRVGVIHRDLKPSNVMLARASEGPRAVVTDFGLARSFVPTGETTATLSGHIVGTLDYLAPELLTGHAATVASDIYALGMVAYKMVTGSLPFAAETPLAAAILRSKVPVLAPRSVVPALDPDWDRAIVRALDADPTRRFSNAAEFVKALRGEATSVTVSLPAMTRRRVAAAVAAAVFLIAASFALRAWLDHRNQPPPEAVTFYHRGTDDINAGAYFAATKALEQAVRLAPGFALAHAYLAEAWNELDVSEKAGQEMLLARREDSARLSDLERLQVEAVDLTITREFTAAVSKYEQMRRIADPGESGLDLDLGRAYEKAGQPQKAIESFRRAAEGPFHDPAAWLWLGILYGRSANWPKSAEAFRRSEELYQLTSNLEGLTEVEYQRGIFANSRGALDEAAAYLHRALDTAHLAGNIHQELNSELRLGTNAYLSGDGAAAERYAREALETAQANQMEALAIRGLINLGGAYFRKQDFTGAEKYHQQALALARRNNARHLAALSLLNLAADHDQLNRSADTLREAQEALQFYEANRFARESLQCFTLLGRAQTDRGNYSAALDWFRRSLSVAENAGDRGQMALAHESIGSIYDAQEQYPKALEHYSQNLQLSTDDEHIGYAGLQCGDVLWRLGRYDEAAEMLDKASTKAGKFPPLQLQIARARAEMALSQRHFTESASGARGALESQRGQDPLTRADLTRILGLAELALGRKREGLENCEEALKATAKLEEVSVVLKARMAVAEARLRMGDRDGSASIIRDAETLLATRPESRWRALALLAGPDPRYRARARQALGQLSQELGDAAFRGYRARPDVQELLRPLGSSDFAIQ
jgi:tetratricopeptide (TPR) repeat protein